MKFSTKNTALGFLASISLAHRKLVRAYKKSKTSPFIIDTNDANQVRMLVVLANSLGMDLMEMTGSLDKEAKVWPKEIRRNRLPVINNKDNNKAEKSAIEEAIQFALAEGLAEQGKSFSSPNNFDCYVTKRGIASVKEFHKQLARPQHENETNLAYLNFRIKWYIVLIGLPIEKKAEESEVELINNTIAAIDKQGDIETNYQLKILLSFFYDELIQLEKENERIINKILEQGVYGVNLVFEAKRINPLFVDILISQIDEILSNKDIMMGNLTSNQEKLLCHEKELEAAVKKEDYQKAATVRDEIAKIKADIKKEEAITVNQNKAKKEQ